MDQPTLFAPQTKKDAVESEPIALYALGEFQARGKALAGRELPLDRLRGALRRAAEAYDVAELSDEEAVAAFGALGAQVRRVPVFIAKHPFRVLASDELAERALQFYQQQAARRASSEE